MVESASTASTLSKPYSGPEEKTPAEKDEETKGPVVVDLTDDSKVNVENLVDWKVEHARLCDIFNQWCRDNGVRMPKL